MEIALFREQGLMTVDGVARKIDLAGLAAEIEVLRWNTVRNTGVIQYRRGETVEVQDRDLEAERVEERRRRENNLEPLQDPIYKTVQVPRPNHVLGSFDYLPYYDQWLMMEDWVPPEPAEVIAAREAQIAERNADNDTVGVVDPRTILQLKNLNRADLRAWFDANFATDAQLRRVVRWMFIYLIRRF